jgi:hypothetical protein
MLLLQPFKSISNKSNSRHISLFTDLGSFCIKMMSSACSEASP